MWTFSNNGHAKFHLIWDNVLVSANRVGGKAPTWDHREYQYYLLKLLFCQISLKIITVFNKHF